MKTYHAFMFALLLLPITNPSSAQSIRPITANVSSSVEMTIHNFEYDMKIFLNRCVESIEKSDLPSL